MQFRFKGAGDNPTPHMHTFSDNSTRALVPGELVDSEVDLAANHPDRFEKLDDTVFVEPAAPVVVKSVVPPKKVAEPQAKEPDKTEPEVVTPA